MTSSPRYSDSDDSALTMQLRSFRQRLEGEGLAVDIDPDLPASEQFTHLQDIMLRQISRCRQLESQAKIQQRIEEALRDSEERYRTLFTNMTEGFALGETIFDDTKRPVSFRFLEINEAFLHQTGLPREIVGQSITEALPQLEAVWIERYTTVAITGVSTRFTEYNRDTDRYYEVYCYRPARDRFAILFRDVTQQRRTEEALRLERDKWRAVFDNVDVGLGMFDRQGTTLSMNAAALAMYGFTSETEMPRRVDRYVEEFEVQYPDGRVMPVEEWPPARALRGEDVRDDDVILLRRASGVARYLSYSIIPIRDPDGQVMLYLFNIVDLTERKQAEEALKESQRHIQESEEALRAIFNSTYDAILLHNLNGAIVDANDTFLRVYGVESVEQACTLTVADISSPAAPLESLPALWARAQVGETQLFEWKAKRFSDSQEFDVEVFLRPIQLHGRQMLLANVRDITERKRAETALRESEEDLNRAQSVAHIGSWRLDVREGVLLWSNETYRIFGMPQGAPMTYETFLATIHPDDVAYVDHAWQAALRGELYDIEHRIVVHGNVKWVRERAELDVDAQGTLCGGFGTVQDVTERKQAEQERERLLAELQQLTDTLELRVQERTAALEATNRELEAFSYSVSHDLRAPLRSIDGFSKIILEKYGAQVDATGQDYLARIRNAALRMGRLIEDMLNLSRIGRREMRRETVNLSALATTILGELRQRDPERQVAVEIAPGLQVHADPALLRIVLDNLLGNAWKFTGKTAHARITVGHAKADSETIYYIRDNGAGFDMSYADKLFSPFQRLHSEEEFPGTGIGLAIVQRIITRHGGRVWAEGEEGKGATVYFTLGEAG